jgi:hypothetical protein
MRHNIKKFTRMVPADSEFLINLFGPKIAQNYTTYRAAVTVTERLEVPLWFMANGDWYTSLLYFSKISKQAFGQIIP